MELTVFIAAGGAVFGICGYNTAAEAPMFWLLLNGACAVARQGFMVLPLCALPCD